MIKSNKLPQYRPFLPSKSVAEMLAKQRITAPNESPHQMMERVITAIFSVEPSTTEKELVVQMQERLSQYMIEGCAMLGTPTLTNAGRHTESALSSCVVIPVNLRNKKKATQMIKAYYKQNMGSGFDFTSYEDPLGMLHWVNQLSAEETATGLYDRYIGNMGSLHISHPRIEEFVEAKKVDGVIKHFNISVDLSSEFMQAVLSKGSFKLANGRMIDAYSLFHKIAENAWKTGDPGVLFLERMNQDNPVPKIGRYVSTPPCGEMGLAEGETCQFGYVNLAKFVNGGNVDWRKLAEVTQLMVRCLDNAVEYSLHRLPNETSSRIALLKRKIGIGVCGLAEALIQNQIPYDSKKGITFARDLLSYINYISKVESVALAKSRGSCLSMRDHEYNLHYYDFIKKKYASQATNSVTREQWSHLSDEIKDSGTLRNIITTALPPTGRASIIMGVTASIEPIFSIFDDGVKEIKPVIVECLINSKIQNITDVINRAKSKGSFQSDDQLPPHVKNILKTAKEINKKGHIAMVSALAGISGVVDEAASKTVNLPHTATIEDVENTYIMAYQMGLKNVALYRDKSKAHQPKVL